MIDTHLYFPLLVSRQDPEYVIAATHGKRAIDNLKQFKPHLQPHELPEAVQAFEESILAYADQYGISQKQQQKRARATSAATDTRAPSIASASSGELGTESESSSRRSSTQTENSNFGFGNSKLSKLLGEPMSEPVTREELAKDIEEAWETEQDVVDRSVRILPGVRSMIDSLPPDRYCVATSGAKTYGKPYIYTFQPSPSD